MRHAVSLSLLGCHGEQNELQGWEHTFWEDEKTGLKESVI